MKVNKRIEITNKVKLLLSEYNLKSKTPQKNKPNAENNSLSKIKPLIVKIKITIIIVRR